MHNTKIHTMPNLVEIETVTKVDGAPTNVAVNPAHIVVMSQAIRAATGEVVAVLHMTDGQAISTGLLWDEAVDMFCTPLEDDGELR